MNVKEEERFLRTPFLDNFRIADHPPRTLSFACQNAVSGAILFRNASISIADPPARYRHSEALSRREDLQFWVVISLTPPKAGQMQRRQFITLTGIAAIETQGLASATLAASERSTWQPDGVGSLARIGVLTPDFDPVPESEMWAMAPKGVSIHAARVTWEWNHDPREFAQAPQLDNATDQLAALKPRAIVYAFTSSSYALGAEAEGALRARLEKRVKSVPVILTCMAATEALRVIGAHRIALIHPPWFSEEVNARGKDYFRTQGFEAVLCARITPNRSFTEVLPTEVYDWAKANVPRQAEAVFIGGNGLRAIGAIQALEDSLAKPVLTANQVSLWKALRLASPTSVPTQYGRVFTLTR